jgi:uncharacterized membrane protein YhaH (DUF805 family)
MAGIVLFSAIVDALLKAQGVITGILVVLLIWPGVASHVKRAHDRGRSGWFVLLGVVPIVAIWPAIEIAFLRGDVGPNRFGPDPLGPAILKLTDR